MIKDLSPSQSVWNSIKSVMKRAIGHVDLILVFSLIVGIGILSRIWMIDVPNFKPVGAIALFAGFYFRRAEIGLLAVFCLMLASDLILGFYEPMLMLAVYGSFIACCLLGRLCVRCCGKQYNLRSVAGFAGVSVAMSCIFFVATNLAVWASGQWYPMTLQGLSTCFAAAIPFFRNTLASDFLFSQAILMAYGFASMTVLRPAAAPATDS